MTGDSVEQLLDPASVRRIHGRVRSMAWWMDSVFTAPGTRLRVGLDPLIGLAPVVGDAVSVGMAGYVLWEARRLGVMRRVVWRILGNTAVDFLVGLVPVVGDAADILYRSNARNLRVLEGAIAEAYPHVLEAPAAAREIGEPASARDADSPS